MKTRQEIVEVTKLLLAAATFGTDSSSGMLAQAEVLLWVLDLSPVLGLRVESGVTANLDYVFCAIRQQIPFNVCDRLIHDEEYIPSVIDGLEMAGKTN